VNTSVGYINHELFYHYINSNTRVGFLIARKQCDFSLLLTLPKDVSWLSDQTLSNNERLFGKRGYSTVNLQRDGLLFLEIRAHRNIEDQSS